MQYQVDILVNGKPVKKYGHDGKIFVEAKDGAEYSIRIKNNTVSKVEIVTTVDGLDVISGQLGSISNRGYLIDGFDSETINGWRESDEKVRAFKFAAKDKSYAANTDETDYSSQDCGVIAVTIFNEKPKPEPRPRVIKEKEIIYVDRPYPVVWPRRYPYYDPPQWGTYCSTTTTSNTCGEMNKLYSSASAESRSFSGNSANLMSFSSAPAAAMPEAVQKIELSASASSGGRFDMGTEYSETVVDSRVTKTQFERGSEGPTFTFYYASRKELKAMGVSFEKETQVAIPQAFPKDSGSYCKPPKKRR